MNRTILGIALVTVLAACGTDAESREDRESQAALQSSQADTSQPTRTAPVEPVRAIPAGTVLTFEVSENVSTSFNAPGDGFSLMLVDAVSGPAGAILPAGTAAHGVVTDVHKSTGPDDDALLGIRITTVEAERAQRPIIGTVQSTELKSSTQDSGTRTAAKIATGTAAGAIIGQILGGDTRSTVIGAGAGTVVGVVVALTTRGGDATLPAGSLIVVRLDQDLVY
jgi:predicted extracellular nuclease